MESIEWTREASGPVYTASLSKRRTAKIVKTRLVVGFAWVASVTNIRGEKLVICRDATLKGCKATFAESLQRYDELGTWSNGVPRGS